MAISTEAAEIMNNIARRAESEGAFMSIAAWLFAMGLVVGGLWGANTNPHSLGSEEYMKYLGKRAVICGAIGGAIGLAIEFAASSPK